MFVFFENNTGHKNKKRCWGKAKRVMRPGFLNAEPNQSVTMWHSLCFVFIVYKNTSSPFCCKNRYWHVYNMFNRRQCFRCRHMDYFIEGVLLYFPESNFIRTDYELYCSHVFEDYNELKRASLGGWLSLNVNPPSIILSRFSTHRPTTICMRDLITRINSSPLGKMAIISQTIFAFVFSWLKSFVFWLKFHWSLFLRVQLSIM